MEEAGGQTREIDFQRAARRGVYRKTRVSRRCSSPMQTVDPLRAELWGPYNVWR